MKVIITLKDETKREVTISETVALELRGVADALKIARCHLSPEEREQVKSWEIEEDFL